MPFSEAENSWAMGQVIQSIKRQKGKKTLASGLARVGPDFSSIWRSKPGYGDVTLM